MQYIENRSFLIISARPPLAEWLAETDNEEVNPAVLEHKSVYLVQPLNIPSEEQVEKLVQKHSAAIFENELFSWNTERENWPTARDFDTFKEWFSYEYVEEGFDAAPSDIEKE
jgi:hypothetical protein